VAQRRKHTGQFKARVAVEAIAGHKTINQISAEYGVHASQIHKWKKQALEHLPELLDGSRPGRRDSHEADGSRLYQQIGQLTMEVRVSQKKVRALSVSERREMIKRDESPLSIRAQCGLLGVNRGMLYYQPGGLKESDMAVMHLMDEQYTRTPYYGVERMTAWLHRLGIGIGHNRVRRLLRLMGLQAVYPKPHLSRPGGPEHRIWPYLLRGLTIDRPNQVWAADITYIRLWRGFVYLAAVMDWYSRYVLSWSLSTTLDSWFCVEALHRALAAGRPEIFTSEAFTGILQDAGVAISMDGRGRAFDNIFVERLWRSVKYEEVYLKDYGVVDEVRRGLRDYFTLYNTERLHQSLGYKTPAEVYFGDDSAMADLSSGVPGSAYLANVTM